MVAPMNTMISADHDTLQPTSLVKAMKRRLTLLTSILALSLQGSAGVPDAARTPYPATDPYDGWRLAVQAWTFNRFTFSEAVEKVASLGLHWIEAYPGQQCVRASRA